MHILGVIELIIQVYLAIHAGRTGRYWWIFIILFFPLVGSIIYFFVEYLPELNTTLSARASRRGPKPKSIGALQRELDITDCVKNRINLAEAYFHTGQYQNAIELLEKSLTGLHANDLDILDGLCHTHFFNGTFDQAIKYLNQYEKNNGGKLKNNLRLLRAKAHEETGALEPAMEEYKQIANICNGEEARCRYALLLKKQGHLDKAKNVFETILKNARLYPKQYSKFEREWVKIAQSELK